MLCGRQVWAQSLEAIALIVVKSVRRISASCMHASMQIQADSVTCTLPSFDHPKPLRPQCSTLCFQCSGAVITQTAQQFSHSMLWDNPGPKFTNLKRLLDSSPNDLRIPHFLPPEHLLRNQIVVGAVPDASTLWSTYSHRPGHSSLATLQNASANLQYLQASFHSLIQTNSNYRSHRQGETQNHTHTLAAGQQTIPSNVFTTEQSRRIQNVNPMQRLI